MVYSYYFIIVVCYLGAVGDLEIRFLKGCCCWYDILGGKCTAVN